MSIGKRLSELRKQNGLKQTDIAEKLHISQQVVSNIERGITAPDIEQLMQIADVFHISLDELVGRDFYSEDIDDMDKKIFGYLKSMDSKEKELSLGLLSQVAQHRGNDNAD